MVHLTLKLWSRVQSEWTVVYCMTQKMALRQLLGKKITKICILTTELSLWMWMSIFWPFEIWLSVTKVSATEQNDFFTELYQRLISCHGGNNNKNYFHAEKLKKMKIEASVRSLTKDFCWIQGPGSRPLRFWPLCSLLAPKKEGLTIWKIKPKFDARLSISSTFFNFKRNGELLCW